ncbi:MAG TPA: cytochrome c oxidase subunit 4 [Mycobacteriales bacterium]|nr:cytochrome c oxidase subunit 4 [Mycobacteriales bacterium]
MRIEAALFGFLAAFLVPATVIYWIFSEDWTGTACLAFSILLAAMVAYYLWFTARRMEARPEDRPDAEIAEGAGEVGFFAPHSWWPIGMAFGFTVTALGLVIGPFLALMGGAVLAYTTLGLLFEFYVGVNRSQGHTLGQLRAMGERPTSMRKFLGD